MVSWRRAAPTAAALALATTLVAQSNAFQFVIAVSDGAGNPVIDITSRDVVMSEDGLPADVVKVEPFRMPVALTIGVDNGPLSADSLGHYRTGLTDLVKSLPPDVEITLMSIAPQPLMVVKPTTDRLRVLRGITSFAPQAEAPRFTDTIVEFALRIERQITETRRIESIPVLVLVSTTATEAVSYQPPEIERAFAVLKQRYAKVFVTMLSSSQSGGGFAPLNEARQALIGIPLVKLTGGRYEALAASSRLATLLPEFGRAIGALHRKHANQFLVTVNRADGARGPLRNPRIEIARPGLKGTVSLDGLP
jgi:hypothetical protein